MKSVGIIFANRVNQSQVIQQKHTVLMLADLCAHTYDFMF